MNSEEEQDGDATQQAGASRVEPGKKKFRKFKKKKFSKNVLPGLEKSKISENDYEDLDVYEDADKGSSQQVDAGIV